jgi:hypothetical protein
MKGTVRHLALFALALVGLCGAGALAGRALEPDTSVGDSPHGGDVMAAMEAEGGHGEADPVRGLAVVEHGLRLIVAQPQRPLGAERALRFRIVGEDGANVRDFEVEHTKRMHLIVVRRDLTDFQHLHPVMAADGTWSVPLTLDAAGSYRLFADFAHAREATTLAGDLWVDGSAELRDLPAPSHVARSDGGLEVALNHGRVRPGGETSLRFELRRDGRPVALQRYLDAGGHLVALREGDLAFLHVHPEDDPAAARQGSVTFMASFPSAGRYRLFLQTKVDGRIQTTAFTEQVG